MQEICTLDLQTSTECCLEKVIGFQIHLEGVQPKSDSVQQSFDVKRVARRRSHGALRHAAYTHKLFFTSVFCV